jgi:glycosyltransferase involved in cell wall biosynthesis
MAFTQSSQSLMPFPSSAPLIRHAAIIGNHPPRVCGIATFTRDLLAGLKAASSSVRWTVVAMNDRDVDAYHFGDAVHHVVRQDDPDAYAAVADTLNGTGVEVVFLQHEFGIFGGAAGGYILQLLRRLRMPVIVTMHTVLQQPDPDQRRVMDEIVRNAAALVVMTEKGASLLRSVYSAPPEKVHVVPHGAPLRTMVSTGPAKAGIGLGDRKVVTTFGLLSPNKGIETVIKALPHVRRKHPDVLYLVVGATHPNLVAREGEAYRDSLLQLANALGVQASVRFINRFVDDDELVAILQASDVYVTPYLTETQITSGTLSYAIALGCPIVSTPYWHAAEALADGVGVLCPFGDSTAFGEAIDAILSDDRLRKALSERARDAGMPSRWSNVADAYMNIADEVVDPTIAYASGVAGQDQLVL